ncbi:MAG: hypothetical protein Q8O46_03765 [bacterium]|nr:hypothetical protein [bacterium]
MVNTVGSSESKYWNKKMLSLKKEMRLSPKQRSFIIGSMLGDATMRIGIKAKNANFKIDHCLEQKEYVFWKYKILKSFVTTPPKLSYRTTKQGVRYKKSWWFRTLRHPVLTEIYNQFYTKDSYRCGKKIVPDFVFENIDAFVMAVWVMDDGSYNQGNIDISTYSFTLREIEKLIFVVKKKFNITMLYHKDRDKGYRIYCNKKETQKLIDLICPYIIKTMRYKIGLS